MLIWAIALISLALLLFVVELFIPSGGLIGFVATVSMVCGLVCLFWVNTTAGLVATIVVLLVAPFAVMGGLNLFPRTPIGKWLTMRDEQRAGAIRYDPARDQDKDQLIGKQGTAVTDLRPIGMCKINGQRIECLAAGGVILAGSSIQVTQVNGIEIKVKSTV